MIEVKLYTRADCHLCDQTYQDLELLQGKFPHKLTVVDIDNDQDSFNLYSLEIPVVEIGPFTLKAPITRQELEVALEAAQSEELNLGSTDELKNSLEYQKNSSWTRFDSLTYWISKHYLGILNTLLIIYIGLPFLAPIFMQVGFEAPAKLIYRGYGYLCHQLAYRSLFLFGEQPFYPRDAAGVDRYLTYEAVSGLSEGDLALERFEARDFLGNEQMGYKVALCQRDIGIYVGILGFGLLFGITGKRIRGLPWYLWILIGIIPIALDGLSQLISQPPLALLPYRESTPLLRILTGFLFGLTIAWFGYPLLEESMKETKGIMERKKKRSQG